MDQHHPAHRRNSASRIVEITDEHETLLIAFVPVGRNSFYYPPTNPRKENRNDRRRNDRDRSRRNR